MNHVERFNGYSHLNVVYVTCTAAQVTSLQRDVSRLEAQKAQMERQHLDRERQMRGLLAEAARNQKMEVDKLKTQVSRSLFEIEAIVSLGKTTRYTEFDYHTVVAL